MLMASIILRQATYIAKLVNASPPMLRANYVANPVVNPQQAVIIASVTVISVL